MNELLLQPVEETVSDEAIQDFLSRYGFPPVVTIERIPATGSRPAVLIVFRDLSPEALKTLQSRIHQVHWNGRKIEAIVLRQRAE
ncbi:RNA-binding protein [Paraburkholderia phymatum]|uniref:RNA-binding protein n=1 Tax=Paraburkholderia phymatum (strain DSM 17167 / CIP 108236 / LMG 21445 / STM815) TaxID=391038 RepID=B2JLL2_PARP8|nr:hypothetical protein [Paraburkholderia phymatum]ACC72645.1 conserved hypothetical protein [Paraburkholderia phymatum STM815]